MLRRIVAPLRVAVADLLDEPPHWLIARVTLLNLLLHGASDWTLSVPIRILASLMLLAPKLTTSPKLWLALLAANVLIHARAWNSIDNHKFLMAYWCLTCTLAVGSRDPMSVMSHNGRWLIALCFLFAVGWKIGGGEFLDGAFLHHTLLDDSRVEAVAVGLGGLEPNELVRNRALHSALKTIPSRELVATLHSTPAIATTALLLSWWTLLIEGSVAFAFLLRRPAWLHRARDFFLMVFIATTYFVLPVRGFASILAIMGLAQTPLTARKTRAAYLILLGLIQLTAIPWDDFVAAWLSA